MSRVAVVSMALFAAAIVAAVPQVADRDQAKQAVDGLNGLESAGVHISDMSPGTLAQAAYLYQKVLAVHPHDAESGDRWNCFGYVEERLGNYEEALTAYRQASKLRPEWPDPLAGMADVHYRCGEWALAAKYYALAIKRCEAAGLTTEAESAMLKMANERAKLGEAADVQTIAASLLSVLVRDLRPGGAILPAVFSSQILSFRSDSSELATDSYRRLDGIAKTLKVGADHNRTFEIGAHTDGSGSPKSQLLLSSEQAQVVRQQLVKRGVPAKYIRARGYGNTVPVVSNGSSCARARVEIRLVSPAELATEEQSADLAVKFAIVRYAKNVERVVQPGTILHTGDQVRIFVQPRRDCYLLVRWRDATGVERVMYPMEAKSARFVKANEKIWLPAGNIGYQVCGQNGTETFTVVASVVPMGDIAVALVHSGLRGDLAALIKARGLAGNRVEYGTDPHPPLVGRQTPDPTDNPAKQASQRAQQQSGSENPDQFYYEVAFRHD